MFFSISQHPACWMEFYWKSQVYYPAGRFHYKWKKGLQSVQVNWGPHPATSSPLDGVLLEVPGLQSGRKVPLQVKWKVCRASKWTEGRFLRLNSIKVLNVDRMTWRMTVSICVAAMNELDSIVLERDHVTVLSSDCKIQQFLGPLSGPCVALKKIAMEQKVLTMISDIFMYPVT